MNGAQALLETLVASGVDTCFANPGTSEMQLVAAIGQRDDVRPVLCLFEGVVTGAADGYGRMADKPAATLLHLGAGFSNGMANIHNARRAGCPMVNIVGDHASYHLQYDAPLTSDLPALAGWASDWMQVATSPDDLSRLGAEAVQAASAENGAMATLIAPANHAWDAAQQAAPALPVPSPALPASNAIDTAKAMLGNGKKTLLFVGGRALREDNLELLGGIAKKASADIMCVTFPGRLQRGAGRVPVQRLPYFAEEGSAALAPYEQMIIVGTKAPVSFFAYPGKASWLAPEQCEVHTLAEAVHDINAALTTLASSLDATQAATVHTLRECSPAEGSELNSIAIGRIINKHLPAQAIVSDEAATCGFAIYPQMAGAEPHDWLTVTGGAIGQGLPVALGAALACPNRKIIALQADGSAMYTIQALWSMARENVDVTVVLLNNRSYAVLNIELARVGAEAPTPKTLSMLDLSNPNMSFAQMATALGIKSSLATTVEEFDTQFAAAMAQRGPRFIEAMV